MQRLKTIRCLFLASAGVMLLSGCALFAPNPTATPTPSITPTASSTSVPTLPPTITASVPPSASFTPSITLTPSQTATPSNTPTITTTPYPTIIPEPTIGPAGDNGSFPALDKAVKATIGKAWISYVNISDKPLTVVPGTPTAASEIETVYLAAPDTGDRVKIIDLPATTAGRVYWSPNGVYMAYFLENGFSTGLYTLNLDSGINTRVVAINDLNPRGLLSEPSWSPDSSHLVMTLPTAYDLDVYTFKPDGSDFRDQTISGGNDFYPAWSPDGQYLAFVSDRKTCPSWEPNAPGSCYTPDSSLTPPDGGNLYVLDMTADNAQSQPRLLSDKWINAQPHWISRDSLAFITGKPGDPSAGATLWYVDLRSGNVHRITDDTLDGTRIISDTWTSDGNRVIYQEAKGTTHIVMRDGSGKEIARSSDDLNFPRVAFSASWSPDGKRVVIGGHNSSCPYGIIVLDDTFKALTPPSPTPNPGICDPSWSPDGRWIAYGGVSTTPTGLGADGHYDVYVAESSGYGARLLTGKLGGQIKLLGWVGGH